MFESNRNLLEKRKGSAYLMMEGEITATTTRMSHFVISRELCLKLGYSEEGLMQLAVKQGSPPMKYLEFNVGLFQHRRTMPSNARDLLRSWRNTDDWLGL